jgi:imidazolonepropionase-like amidohydrolase
MGTVDAGKHADLVLLDANPVESAGHLHQIAGVVRAGRYYAPTDLDAIKDRIAASQSVS